MGGRNVESGAGAATDTGNGSEQHLDLGHLARQCHGDTALQRDLLCLFQLQAHALMGRIAVTLTEPGELADIAHALRGSALAIGATRVAVSAGALEAAARATGDAGLGLSEAIAALDAEVAAVIAVSDRISSAAN